MQLPRLTIEVRKYALTEIEAVTLHRNNQLKIYI